MLDTLVDKIKALSELNERAAKAAAAQSSVSDMAAQKVWRDAKRVFMNKVRNRKDEAHATLKLSTYQKAKNFIHSTLGSNRLLDDDYVLTQRAESDVRNGRRWIDKLPTIMHENIVNISRHYMTTAGSPANIVAEGDAKPVREKAQNQQIFLMRKLAVTDLVTQEAIYALRNERFLDYLLDAHFEHVLDRLEQLVTQDIIGNSVQFLSSFYSNYGAFPQSLATWHDLVQAMQRDHERNFADHFGIEKRGNIFISYHRTLYGVHTDRKGFGRDYLSDVHNVDRFLLENDFFWWSEAANDQVNNVDRALLLNTNNFELHMLDAAEVFFERVADRVDERNLYRLTAEVYYVVIPRTTDALNRWPAILSADALADRSRL